MEDREQKTWQNINELLSKAAGDLNILEEEIDVEVQRQYMALLKHLLHKNPEYQELAQQALERKDLLLDASTSEREKKRLLVLLATIDDISIYRTIEAFSKQDTPLKKWATVALQQSRMLIQSTLMDESAIFVSTGLGGQGSQLRYFSVFMANDDTTLQPFQYEIVQKEMEVMITKSGGSIEHAENHEKYITFTLLLPINANLKTLFEGIIDECNTYGNFLQKNMIITNVKKLSPEEIEALLRR